jgi:ketosteroid isomerase-like protein
MWRNLCFLILMFFTAFPVLAADGENTEVQSAFNEMTHLWNQGKLQEFINYYKNSPDTIYISSSIIKGFQNIHDRYQAEYSDSATMGKLSTSNIEIKRLSPQYAVIIGEWSLQRKAAPTAHGIFSLLWERTGAGWKIMLDHTSLFAGIRL